MLNAFRQVLLWQRFLVLALVTRGGAAVPMLLLVARAVGRYWRGGGRAGRLPALRLGIRIEQDPAVPSRPGQPWCSTAMPSAESKRQAD